MRVAVLSDIHSNYYAFKACYDDAVKHHADGFIFLGDYVSDLADPKKTMDLVYEIRSHYPTICLRGNREAYMIDCEQGRSRFSLGSKSGSLLFTYEQLRKNDIEFFREMKIYDSIEIDGVQFEIAHALKDNDRYYFDTEDGHIEEAFAQMHCKYLLTGHSHRQYIQRSSEKTIINPGSVGIPQGGGRMPQYAFLNICDGNVTCILREVSYDLSKVIHAQYENGLVDYAKYWAIGILYDIITGDEWVLKLLRYVQETEKAHDEEAWYSAAVKLGMKFTELDVLDFYNSTRNA